jgi:hypothetical protein
MSAFEVLLLIVAGGLIIRALSRRYFFPADEIMRCRRLAYAGIAWAVLASGMLLFVIAPRVPTELKDGLFGAAGAAIMGTVVTCLVQSFMLLRYAKRAGPASHSASAGPASV